MTILLLERPSIGVVEAKPEAPPTVNFDAIVAASGASHHARFLASAGSTAADVIGTIDWTINNTIAWERGALVTDANGGNSAFFNGASPPTYGEATNLITSATWAAMFVFQADKVQEKFILLNSSTNDGGYSIEVEPDGAGGMRARQFTRVAGSAEIWTTGAGSVPTSDAVLLFYLQSTAGRSIYVGTEAGFDLIGDETSVTAFAAPENGLHYLGAWNLTGGLQGPIQGLIGEVAVWDGSVPNEAQMQAIAEKIQNVVFTQNIDAGSVAIGSALSVEVGDHTNPAEDFTPVKLTDPATGGGTVAVDGEHFQITGHDTAAGYSFNYRIDRGTLQSGTATISYTVTEASAATGIQLPEFESFVINDAVPGGAIWWDPTNGSDSNNGSASGQAVATFGQAQSLVSAGGTIAVVGGTHTVPELSCTKSGTSGNPITLMSEPGQEVLLIREDDFLGALDQSWTWTEVDASLGIWTSPDLGIPDGETIVNNNNGAGQHSNSVWGFMVVPSGAHGRPHLMKMLWYDLNGDYEPNAFHNPNTGGSAGERIAGGGYGGPGFFLPGNGRVQVRMQKAAEAYQGAVGNVGWPSDGRMGTLIDANGVWQEPTTEDPNDYAFHIVRTGGTFGSDGPVTLNMNGQSWWHIKGINAALMNLAVRFPSGSENNNFDRCTWWPHGGGLDFRGTTRNNTFTRIRMLTGDSRSLGWSEHKNPNYWWQHARTPMMRGGGGLNSNTGLNTLFEHCTFFGWFDMALSMDQMDGVITLDHCAILNVVDDGFMQTRTDRTHAFQLSYCYIAGGPMWSGAGNGEHGTRDWFCHHCVYDLRIPMLWQAWGDSISRRGVQPQRQFPIHSGGSSGPMYVRKMWNCTLIGSPDTVNVGGAFSQGTSPANHNVPSGRAHEGYNNIWAVIDNQRYAQTQTDSVGIRLSCQQSSAGTHRYDYNCYYRDVPSPVSAFFYEIQNSRNSGRESFTSLADFKSSGKYTTSGSMYGSQSGAFSGSNSTVGHEEHGVQVNPGFVDLANRDYRPTHSSVTSGHLDVSTSGWPGAGDAHSWKGALDPNGDGTEVGPQNG